MFLFGLAPSGVFHALPITAQAVRSYHTISPLPFLAVSFLLHFPSAHAAQTLSGTLSFGARTFLCFRSNCLASFVFDCMKREAFLGISSNKSKKKHFFAHCTKITLDNRCAMHHYSTRPYV